MSDTSTMTQPWSTGTQEDHGRGRHRGPVSSHEGESAPLGRHRKPAEEKADAAVRV